MTKSKAQYSMELMVAERPGGRRQFLLGFVAAVCLMILVDLAFEMHRLIAEERVKVESGELKASWPTPPPHSEVARVARYVVHISDWASISTISTAAPILGFPFGNIVAISDGPLDKASGIPYMYISPMDLSSHDLKADSRASISLSEAQSDFCHNSGYDPEDPRCARILLSGSVIEVKNGTSEADFARLGLFSRHPEMASWPSDHRFFFAKLNITHIYVIDYFGGATDVSIEEYYEATPF